MVPTVCTPAGLAPGWTPAEGGGEVRLACGGTLMLQGVGRVWGGLFYLQAGSWAAPSVLCMTSEAELEELQESLGPDA